MVLLCCLLFAFDIINFLSNSNNLFLVYFICFGFVFLNFVLRGIGFLNFASDLKYNKKLNFVPFLQLYSFTKSFMDGKNKDVNYRFSILLPYVFQSVFLGILLLNLIFPGHFLIYDREDPYAVLGAFGCFIFVFLMWRIFRFIFNLVYLKVLKTILNSAGVENRSILFLIKFIALFVSENLAMLIVLYHYKKNEKICGNILKCSSL